MLPNQPVTVSAITSPDGDSTVSEALLIMDPEGDIAALNIPDFEYVLTNVTLH